MVHTTQDYAGKYRQEIVYGSIDNAELSARQGINSFFDRRGNIVWYDDFEAAAAQKWKSGGIGGGGAALSTERAWMGNQSMKVTTNNVDTSYWTLSKYYSLPMERQMGAEVMFHISAEEPYILMVLSGYTGTHLNRAELMYDHEQVKLFYRDAADNWIELTVVDGISPTLEQWVPMKLVVDWDIGEYLRIFFGGTIYDMTGIPYYTFPSAITQKVITQLQVGTTADVAAIVYFDNFIFTQNE